MDLSKFVPVVQQLGAAKVGGFFLHDCGWESSDLWTESALIRNKANQDEITRQVEVRLSYGHLINQPYLFVQGV